jgi:hypothetical protein
MREAINIFQPARRARDCACPAAGLKWGAFRAVSALFLAHRDWKSVPTLPGSA